MLWLVWRQHRMQVLVTAGLLAAFGAVLLIHDLRTADLAAGLAPGGGELRRLLEERFQSVYVFLDWLPAAPVLVGLFWGAPVLAREFETGTVKLAWTQSVSPLRWLSAKLVGLGALTAAFGLAIGAMVNAWLTRFGDIPNRLADLPLFGGTGVVAAAWWLVAFVLGVAAGTVCRRTLSAMVVTVAAYLVAFLAIASPLFDVRDSYAAPERTVHTSVSDEPPRGSLTDTHWLDASGRALSAAEVTTATTRLCEDRGSRFDYSPCLFENGYQRVVHYHPPDRYWRFQWTEAAILFAVALGLGGHVLRRTTRRLI